MISNSVTDLRSYTNSAIANVARNSAPISPVTPHDRRRRQSERRRRRIERRRVRIEQRRLRIERRYYCIEWRVFQDVLFVSWCFSSGSRCFTCFTCVSCFTMFNNVLWCLASRTTIGIAASAPGDHLRDRDNSAEIGDGAAGIVDITANVIPC